MERSPWHAGEKQLQAHVGVVERMDVLGRRVIRSEMPDQHRAFYQQLPFMLYGAVDADGNPWASILEGAPGFAHSPEPTLLQFGSLPGSDDPAQLQEGAAIGLLGIELHTRRRNRLNGRVGAVTASGFEVKVEQSFGNCPQYIQLREFRSVPLADPATRIAQHLHGLDDAAKAMITGADTFFVASYVNVDGQRSVDVSHRGGQAGFVQVEGNRLTIPDFAGNLFFNTLGNLLINPRAGLLFIDFDSGDLLHLSGRTQVILEGPQVEAFQGAERLWTFEVERVVRRPAALALRWRFDGVSPTSLLTGTWAQANARLQAQALGDRWRPLRVTRIEQESHNIRSIYLEPADGAGLPVFQAGQHLPLRFNIGGEVHIRTYSLSSAPSDDFFRISVKRDGLVSSHLHELIRVGDLLEARAPQGHFTVAPNERRSLVLLAAGVGITPLLSMVREVVYQGLRTRRIRPTWFFQSSRTLADQPFRPELDRLLDGLGDVVRVLRLLSQPEPDAREGEDYDLTGRIDADLLKTILEVEDYDQVDFVLCGPGSFTQGLYDSLRDLDIRDSRIHAETFGPSTLRRKPDPDAVVNEQPPAATVSVPVVFQRSAKEARWQPDGGSLLELAESRGLRPEFSCRGGSCGTCKTRLISGEVNYPQPPAEVPGAGEVLICCAVPAQGSGPLVLDL
ncbi:MULTISPECIES: pyridoxamine 5'-phosphate oxidase family protein [Gammaproteobacteria]|uniref:pyridoxamine 5'-phosphate oxidase family protein n=1 Tax=Gammaproteobacteria TaxID=1236 RepID=UPI0019148FB2|nr:MULTISPECIES: pyridoxamine 5'-phosphate oxidase family protein [Gammaproteobacteria]MBK5302516.1 pyridoxamine 5'-phosphate oxidase family protein [Bacillus sp. TH86]MBK5322285.1 pyridoxamine 5'-phosphate oxidase family protein [Bacillus sp. TH59]MBK5337235.1 pyridoxamine 5'-phosphate oxidase family protein [Bacillus sp. TH57]MBK5311294.1 pyridoxamine 5'-phosphate oxidase family protein [Pseudomonas sp. TH71]MBK5316782.1 pyridoxamine 5'-phosphate oxidase family protein [Erwinia sp. TH79]